MFNTITTCQGCGCDILNERMSKGRLKKWCSNACRQKWRYKNDENIGDKNFEKVLSLATGLYLKLNDSNCLIIVRYSGSDGL